MVYVIMGVAGCGKTTIGTMLAKRIHARFIDADNYHSQSNISKIKMSAPLTDDDRRLWLETLAGIVSEHLLGCETLVLACSALKSRYRRTLVGCSPLGVRFVYLKCKVETVKSRLASREGHFAPPSIADSQFADLEEPRLAFTVDGEMEPETIVDLVCKWIYGELCGC